MEEVEDLILQPNSLKDLEAGILIVCVCGECRLMSILQYSFTNHSPVVG